jgi:hypothetical protein
LAGAVELGHMDLSAFDCVESLPTKAPKFAHVFFSQKIHFLSFRFLYYEKKSQSAQEPPRIPCENHHGEEQGN